MNADEYMNLISHSIVIQLSPIFAFFLRGNLSSPKEYPLICVFDASKLTMHMDTSWLRAPLVKGRWARFTMVLGSGWCQVKFEGSCNSLIALDSGVYDSSRLLRSDVSDERHRLKQVTPKLLYSAFRSQNNILITEEVKKKTKIKLGARVFITAIQ